MAAVLLLSLAGPLVGTAAAQPSQSVNAETPNQVAGQSAQVFVTFDYNASSQNTTGLGLRIHFNSSKLTFLDFPFVFGGAGGGSLFVMGPSEVEDDTANQDGDSNTNKILLLAWVHTLSGFTGTSLPTDLFTARFTTAANFSGNTTVRITAVDTASGYSFSSSPATITAPGAPTPTPTATPAGPTPTPTPQGGTSILDIDGNGIEGALSDGIMIMRWLLEIRGSALTANAVSGNCTRCTIAQIEAHLTQYHDALDIDDNGISGALSDGIMSMRWMLEIRGSALTANAVAGNCNRCTVQEIEDYLDSID